MKATCQLVSNVVLPSIRAWVAKEAIQNFWMKQKDVAKYLGLTMAAVSQYLKKRRADVWLGEKELKEIKPFIGNIAKKMASGELTEFDLMKLVRRICTSLRASLILCKLHMKVEHKLKKINCRFCEELFEGYKKIELSAPE